MSKAIQWYEKNAASVVDRYEKIDPKALHSWLEDLLPSKPSVVLDVGAGTGRDAAWLARRGYEVAAVEPTAALRERAKELHPNASICWFEDKLPSLKGVIRSRLSFDFILLSAVWMHLPKGNDRKRAFRKLVGLLKPGGVIAISLRMGPTDRERGIYGVSPEEIRQFARNHALVEVRFTESADHSERKQINWINIAFRAPDDGTGALPLLRHVILKDAKSSTYKLALLRALCRAADGSAGMITIRDKHVAVPLGLVALNWIRLFKPLLKAELPQNRKNEGYSNLRFAKEPFQRIVNESNLDLRVGMTHSGERGAALHKALRDAVKQIQMMPAHYLTYPNGKEIFPIPSRPPLRQPAQVRLEKDYLSKFGEIRVPWNLWQAMQRFDVWIEPALVAEWSRMIQDYAQKQGRRVSDKKISAAMTWHEPNRSVLLARNRAKNLILTNGELRCVWTNEPLKPKMLDMDHCFPWAAWPCGDLWNLMPTHPKVNRKKRACLPSDDTLKNAQDRIMRWWDKAYIEPQDHVNDRFWTEVHSSLPGGEEIGQEFSDIFEALRQQRMRLKYDQQIPEWKATG